MQPEKKSRKVKMAILVVVIAFIISSVGFILFFYLPMLTRDKSLVISPIPLEEDFHLSKGLLQEGKKEYFFNISIATEFLVDITSNKPINLKLYNSETTKMDKNWVQTVYDSVVLKRGIWVVSIAPSNSNANGRVKITTRTPLLPYTYVHMFATREAGGSNITMNYEDELEETISVHLSVKSRELTVIWNYTESGEERNKFEMTWSDASKYQNYVVKITTNHRVFGNLTYRVFTYGQFSP